MKRVITPHLFEDRLIISLSNDWIAQFETIPHFVATVDSNKKLVIKSIEGVSDRK